MTIAGVLVITAGVAVLHNKVYRRRRSEPTQGGWWRRADGIMPGVVVLYADDNVEADVAVQDTRALVVASARWRNTFLGDGSLVFTCGPSGEAAVGMGATGAEGEVAVGVGATGAEEGKVAVGVGATRAEGEVAVGEGAVYPAAAAWIYKDAELLIMKKEGGPTDEGALIMKSKGGPTDEGADEAWGDGELIEDGEVIFDGLSAK